MNSGTLAGSVSQCNTQEDACNSAASAKKRRAALDFGSCGSPAIQFAVGLDGRKEASFQAVDLTSFNHGSALNIGVIASFNCQQLSSKCKAGAATISACATAQTAAGKCPNLPSFKAYN